MITVREAFLRGVRLLSKTARPRLESKILLRHAASLSEEGYLRDPNRCLSRADLRRFEGLVKRRVKGFPLAYLIGEKEFWLQSLRVTPAVLIPRPETELLVEKVCELSSHRNETIVDVGTGSGNIALALAEELPRASLIATDISLRALRIARLNAGDRSLKRIAFLHGDLLSPVGRLSLRGRCDFIVSNPPYVSVKDWTRLASEIRDHEPKRALVAGQTGLEVISRLVRQAAGFLKSAGWLVFELGEGQLRAVLALLGPAWKDVSSARDLRGIPRVVMARKA